MYLSMAEVWWGSWPCPVAETPAASWRVFTWSWDRPRGRALASLTDMLERASESCFSGDLWPLLVLNLNQVWRDAPCHHLSNDWLTCDKHFVISWAVQRSFVRVFSILMTGQTVLLRSEWETEYWFYGSWLCSSHIRWHWVHGWCQHRQLKASFSVHSSFYPLSS